MVDQRFYNIDGPFSIEYLLNYLGSEIHLAHPFQKEELAKVMIYGVAALDEATPQHISIFTNPKYQEDFLNTKARACIVSTSIEKCNEQTYLLQANNPYYQYSKIINLFYRDKILENEPHLISKKAKIGSNCNLGRNVIIQAGAEIGDNCTIEDNTVIKVGVIIGSDSHIGPNCYISHSIIGKRAMIFPGACIGREGFGIATSHGKHQKIFHAGKVVIGDDVEIGANSVIERGSISDTIINDMCKVSHLVLVGHNVNLGYGCVVVGQSGIAGSTALGKYCSLGGQSGIAGHLKIADFTQVAAQSGVMRSIAKTNQTLGGSPAIPINDWHKQTIFLQKSIKRQSHD